MILIKSTYLVESIFEMGDAHVNTVCNQYARNAPCTVKHIDAKSEWKLCREERAKRSFTFDEISDSFNQGEERNA